MDIETVKRKIYKRRYAYRRLLLTENGKLNSDAETMLADLAKFCRANASTAVVNPITRSVDPIASAKADGRREVWLRILAHLHIDDREIFNLTENQDE